MDLDNNIILCYLNLDDKENKDLQKFCKQYLE
jgi:hypothetical protein